MVETSSDGVNGGGVQATNGTTEEDSRSESRRSSKASILTPERLLEGLVDFPSLFPWDQAGGPGQLTIPGQMTVAALMKIGLVYSFVWLIKAIDTVLRKIILINFIYTTIIDILSLILLTVALIITIIFKLFNFAVQLVPIRAFRNIVSGIENSFLRFLNQQDTYIAFRIKEYLWTHPRAQETFSELIDDLLHRLLRSSCKSTHPNSNLSRGEQIDKAFEGLSKKSFEVETS